MTDEGHSEEGAEEAVEDLEAPASAQADVAGGAGCGDPSMVCNVTCQATNAKCIDMSHRVDVFEL